MGHRQRRRFYVEAVMAAVAGVLGLITIFWRNWIEVSGWDPDQHDGSAEWFVVLGLLVMSLAIAAIAHREWTRGLAAPTGSTSA